MKFISCFVLALICFNASAAQLIIKHQSKGAIKSALSFSDKIQSAQRLTGAFHQFEIVSLKDGFVPESVKAELERHPDIEKISISQSRFSADLPERHQSLVGEIKDPPLLELPTQIKGIDPLLKKNWSLAKMGVFDAWKITQGSPQLTVAVIDSGIDYNHEDLAASIWRGGKNIGWDFVNNDALPYDDFYLDLVGHIGHGTHVASIIAAQAENSLGVAGVAPMVKILPLKFLNSSNRGEDADAIKAMSYALNSGAKIINASWGGTGDPDSDENKIMYDAISILRDHGVLLVAAAGNSENNNDGSEPVLPASYKLDNIISVAKSDRNDEMPSNSGHGKNSVHLMAPGQDVIGAAPKNKYRQSSGTSFAVPHVVGALALVWSRHPEWNYQQVRQAVLKTVDPAGRIRGPTITDGRVSALKALNYKN